MGEREREEEDMERRRATAYLLKNSLPSEISRRTLRVCLVVIVVFAVVSQCVVCVQEGSDWACSWLLVACRVLCKGI